MRLVARSGNTLTDSEQATADATIALRRWITAAAPVVEAVEVNLPALVLVLHDGHGLEIAPTSADGECWRLLRNAIGGHHAVVYAHATGSRGRRMTEFTISFFAIPPAFGGRSSPLFDGYRPHLWWPRHVRECLEYGRDGQFLELSYDEVTREGVARIRLVGPVPPLACER